MGTPRAPLGASVSIGPGPDLMVSITCPACGHDLAWHALGAPQERRTEVRAVGHCTGCPRQWVIQVRLALAHTSAEGKASARNRKVTTP